MKVAVLLLVAAAAALPAPASGATRSCSPPNHPGRVENVIDNLRAIDASCRTARLVSSKVRAGQREPLGFHCRRRQGDGYADYSCRRSARRVLFRIIVF